MRFFVFWLTLAVCGMVNVVATFGQLTFERKGPGDMAMEVIRDSDGSYFLLTAFSGIHGITKMSATGKFEGHVLSKDYDMTSYSNRLSDFCRTPAGLAAVGVENSTKLIFFTCTADLQDRQLRTNLLAHDVSSVRITALADNGYAVLTDFGTGELKVLRLDAAGNVLWTKVFDEANRLTPIEIYEASNNDLILVANYDDDGMIIRAAADGTLKSKKLLSGADHLTVFTSQFKNDHVYLLGAASPTNAELFHIDETGQLVDRDFMFTHDYLYYDSRFTMTDDGRVALTTKLGPTSGFDLLLFDAALVREQRITFDRGQEYYTPTSALSITDASDGFLITATAADALVIKTDVNGGTGVPPPFDEIDDTGLQSNYGDHHYTSVDVDNDGRQELIIANSRGVSILSYNVMTRKFSPLTSSPLPGDLTDIRSFSTGDFNNDGMVDLYANRYAGELYGSAYEKLNILFENNGNGTFRATMDANINNPGSPTVQSAWIDINNDGYHDLFTVNRARDKAYLNNGDGSFTEMSAANFEQKTGWTLPTHYVFTDINEDGYIDYIASQNQQVDIMINVKGERFEKHGLLEYFNFSDPYAIPFAIYDYALGYVDGKKVAMLMDRRGSWFEHDGNIFRHTEMPEGHEYNNNPVRGEFIDFENDGDQDTYLDGLNSYDISGNIFNRNDNDHGFTYYRKFSRESFRGFIFMDVERNGSLDLIGGYSSLKLLRNTSANNWLVIKLRGNRSSAMGDGATVSVKANGKWMHKVISTHGGNNGVAEFEAHFGMNAILHADSVIVKWPSGCVTVQRHVPANEIRLIEESCTGVAPTVSAASSICPGESLVLIATTPGEKFKWFTSLSSPSIASTGREVTIDTLTRSVTLFVANADSAILSRRQPVTINVVRPPDFEIKQEQVGDNLQLSIDTDDTIDLFKWSVNGEFAAEGLTCTYPVTMVSEALVICGESKTAGCVSEQCVEVIVTSVEDAAGGYSVYPNPFSSTFRLALPKTENVRIEVFTIRGELLMTLDSANDESVEVNMKDYPAGMYLIKAGGNVFLKAVKGN